MEPSELASALQQLQRLAYLCFSSLRLQRVGGMKGIAVGEKLLPVVQLLVCLISLHYVQQCALWHCSPGLAAC